MKISVSAAPEIECGVDRGGEDLFIVFSTQLGAAPDLENINEVEVDIDGCLHDGISIDILEDDGDVTINRVRWTTSQYEFSWEGGKKDLAKLVKEALKDEKNWSRPGLKKQVYKFEYRHFVDGNAD